MIFLDALGLKVEAKIHYRDRMWTTLIMTLGNFYQLPGSVERFGFANGTRLRLGTPKSFNNLLGSVTVLSIASNDGPKAVKVKI